jgi:hypothetical protein
MFPFNKSVIGPSQRVEVPSSQVVYAADHGVKVGQGVQGNTAVINSILANMGTAGKRVLELPPGIVDITEPVLIRDDYRTLRGAPGVMTTTLRAVNFTGPAVVVSPRGRLRDNVTLGPPLATGSGNALFLQTGEPLLELFTDTWTAPLNLNLPTFGLRFFYKRTVGGLSVVDAVITCEGVYGVDPYGLRADFNASHIPYAIFDRNELGIIFIFNNVRHDLSGTVLTTGTTYYFEVWHDGTTVYLWVGQPGQTATLAYSGAASPLSRVEQLSSRVYLGHDYGAFYGHQGGYIDSVDFFYAGGHTAPYTCPTTKHTGIGSGSTTNFDNIQGPFVVGHNGNGNNYLYVNDAGYNNANVLQANITDLCISCPSNGSGIFVDNGFRTRIDNVSLGTTYAGLTVVGSASYQSNFTRLEITSNTFGVLLDGNLEEMHGDRWALGSMACPMYFGLTCSGTISNLAWALFQPTFTIAYFATDSIILQSIQTDDEGGALTSYPIIADHAFGAQNAGIAKFIGGQFFTTTGGRPFVTCVRGGLAQFLFPLVLIQADCPEFIKHVDTPQTKSVVIGHSFAGGSVIPLTLTPSNLSTL